jgi:Sap, sulfolipid-1-addressing protein
VGDVLSIFGLSLFAMFNPTLLAAVAIMMLLPGTKRLMFGYLLGAYLTSIAAGLVVVYTLHGRGSVETTKRTLSPLEDLLFGAIALIVAWALLSGRAGAAHERRAERKAAKQKDKGDPKPSLPERLLGRGSARVAFAVGAVLSFPGVSYIAALDKMSKLGWSTAGVAAAVVVFCLIQQLLLEVPLLGYAAAPERTQVGVERFREWIAANGRRAGGWALLVIGVLLVVRGVVELIVT